MFRLGAATVFRKISRADPHRQHTIDAIDRIGQDAGLYDDDHRQSIIDAAFKDAKQPAPNGKAATIVTPADLQIFFAGWHAAIAEAPDREAKWQQFTATVRDKLLTMEIGRNAATANFRRIAAELDLCGATELDDKVTAALDGTPTMTGHAAAPAPDDYGATIPIAHLPATIDDTSAIVPAKFITPAAWPNEAPPPVDWLVPGSSNVVT